MTPIRQVRHFDKAQCGHAHRRQAQGKQGVSSRHRVEEPLGPEEGMQNAEQRVQNAERRKGKMKIIRRAEYQEAGYQGIRISGGEQRTLNVQH